VKDRLIKKIFSLLLPVAFLFLSGFATSPDGSKQPLSPSSPSADEGGKDPFSDFPDRYRLKAREAEKRGDLPKAFKAWKVVKSFVPADEEAEGKIAQLKNQIATAADQHFRKGLALFQSHSYALAQKEFLFALYLQPDHDEAIQYLKQKMAGEDILTYEVKKGDTIKEVARKVYKDAQKDFLIAYFNGLKVDSQIEPSLILRMPILTSPPSKGITTSAKMVADPTPEMAKDIQEILGKARDAYRGKNYQESLALAEKVLEYDPANRECRELMNASYYHLGKQLGQEKKYKEALEAFQRVDSGYKDVSLQLLQNRKQLAEAHYIKGVQFFIGEEIERAIREWEATLTLEPKHPKARKDIESARSLLQKLEKVK
jgi:tetratricopeptide (TPR) repeat protein